jgi:hypothetical protein
MGQLDVQADGTGAVAQRSTVGAFHDARATAGEHVQAGAGKLLAQGTGLLVIRRVGPETGTAEHGHRRANV